jgi:hypothetical protein
LNQLKPVIVREKNVMLEALATEKIHINKLPVYHLVIPASPSVALDEVTLSLMQVDNRQWQRNAGNHPFPGTLSLKGMSLF